jgi:hypothetical protein
MARQWRSWDEQPSITAIGPLEKETLLQTGQLYKPEYVWPARFPFLQRYANHVGLICTIHPHKQTAPA